MRPPPTGLNHLPKALAKMENGRAEVQDPLKEINLEIEDDPKPFFISKLRLVKTRMTIITLLTLHKDCFLWGFSEMHRLDRDLVKHYLSIKLGFQPF